LPEKTVALTESDMVLERTGMMIGRYKLLQQIGEGGFGVVFMAEQMEPVQRKVALKVIKAGMDTREVNARFEAERQALALMDHPNIAQVLDGGATASGRPYFVMELVRGLPITQYSDQYNLATRERLELFIKVCRAVQHAHQKGVIHRDLKPTNVLVTLHDGEPVPKVIDFGVAKALGQKLTEKTLFTRFEQMIGTPAYMSPEQAALGGLDIDTRADIYSLGVLLYELLTGVTPLDAETLRHGALDEIRRLIRETDPPKPSTRLLTLGERLAEVARQRHAEPTALGRLIRGDLDWITMKALEKDRRRRYETVNGLAADIERHLRDEPVTARPPSAVYRLQKVARRHRVAFAAGSVVAFTLVLGVIISTWQAVRARRAQAAEARERRSADDARQRAVKAQLAVQKSAYAADMLLAFQALETGHLGRLRELLSKYDPPASGDSSSGLPMPELRGWEWRYLWEHARGDELLVLSGHSNTVYGAWMLNDGRNLLSASSDHTIRFWNVATRSVLESIRYPEYIRSAALSPDGRVLAVGGRFGYWSLRDVLTRRLLLERTNSTAVSGVAFAADGQRVALADSNSVEIWDVSDCRNIATLLRSPKDLDGHHHGIAFSPDGRSLAYAHGDYHILLYDFASKSNVMVGDSADGDALSLAFSPDGRTLVAADRRQISLWDVAGRLPPRHLTNHLEQVESVAFSPDGKLLASGSGDQTILLWDAESWQPIATLRGHEGEVRSVSFSADGKRLVSGGEDETVRVWSADAGATKRQSVGWTNAPWIVPNKPTANRLIVFPPQGETLDSIRFLDLLSLDQSESRSLPDVFRSSTAIAISGDASLVAVGLKQGAVELWSTEPLERLREVARSDVDAINVAVGENRRWLAVGRRDQKVELWDLENNELVQSWPPLDQPIGTHLGDSGQCAALSFWSADRRLVLVLLPSQAAPELIAIYLIPERRTHLIRPTRKAPLSNFALSEDGGLLAASAYDGQIRIWEVATGRELGPPLRGQMIGFAGLSFSPDGSRLAAGGWDGTITLWDVAAHQQVGSWKAHRKACRSLSFIEGGRTLVSRGCGLSNLPYALTTEVRVWQAPAWTEVEAAEKISAR